MNDPNTAPPPVLMLRARLDNDWLEEDAGEIFSEPKPFSKYSAMEDMAFRLANRDPEKYEVHFHMESFGKCTTQIKALLWNEGAYFNKPHLLKDGFLRLIPHFRTNIPRRALWHTMPKIPAVTSIPTTASPMTVTMDTNVSSAAGPMTVATTSVTQSPVAPVLTRSEDTNELSFDLDEEDDFGPDLVIAKDPPERNRLAAFFDPELFRPKAKSPLPKDLSLKTWRAELNNWKERCDAEYKPVDEPSRIKLHRRKAAEFHIKMIEGRYGMRAVPPCLACDEAEQPCRVYHPDCYTWHDGPRFSGGEFNMADIGWRCARCRTYPPNSDFCDVQFDPSVYQDAKTERAKRREAASAAPHERV